MCSFWWRHSLNEVFKQAANSRSDEASAQEAKESQKCPTTSFTTLTHGRRSDNDRDNHWEHQPNKKTPQSTLGSYTNNKRNRKLNCYDALYHFIL